MEQENLVLVCVVAFAAVILLLTALAIVMSFITRVFPVVKDEIDQGVVAAIHAVAASLFPGGRVTQIKGD